MEEKISEAIKAAVEAAPERKFVESVDISFTIKDVDLKEPDQPYQGRDSPSVRPRTRTQGRHVRRRRGATKAKAAGLAVFSPKTSRISVARRDRRKRSPTSTISSSPKSLTWGSSVDTSVPFWVPEEDAPPGASNARPRRFGPGLSSTVVVKSGDKMTFHASFGTVEQSHEELLANAMEVYNRVLSKLERGIGNIRSLFIKTSMGPSQRIEVVN